MKRKRVGAGQRGSSNLFLTGKDLLKSCGGGDGGGFVADPCGGPSAPNVTSSIRARANATAAAAAASLGSPTKAGRALSKKQAKLAEAAKSSRNISQYFTKKVAPEERLEERLEERPEAETQENGWEQEVPCLIVEESETEEVTPEETQDEAVVVLNDNEEEIETIDLERGQEESERRPAE